MIGTDKTKVWAIFLLIAALGACAGPQKVGDRQAKGKVPISVEDANRAPASMSPPAQIGDQMVDPTYLRSQADYHFTLAETYSLEGDRQRAIEEFKLTLVYDPHSAMVRTRLSAEYIKARYFTEALEQAELAVRDDPDYIEARLLLGGIFSSAKLYEKAADQYRTVIQKHPQNMDAHLYLGAVLAEKSSYDEAVEIFEKVGAKSESDRHRAYYYVARVEMERGRTRAAIHAFQKSLRANPEYTDAVLDLGVLYEKEGSLDQAFALFKSFQDKFGPKEKIAEPLARMYLEKKEYKKAYRQLEIVSASEPGNLNVRVKMALISIELKEHKIAIAKLKEVLSLAPQSDKIRFYLAAVYEEIGDKKSAIKNFAKTPPTSSYYNEAIIHTSFLYKEMGKEDKAVEVVKEGIESRGDIPQFYALYASLLDDQKQYGKAIEMLQGATERFPKNEQLMFFLGSMHDKNGDKKKTISQMKQVLAINPEHVQALNYLAYTYAELVTDLEEAEMLARKAVSLKSDDAYIRDTLGWVLYNQGRYADAVKYLESAYKMNPKEAIIAEHLGDAYYRFQLPEKAKTMYLKAVEIETDENILKNIHKKLSNLKKGERMPASQLPSSSP